MRQQSGSKSSEFAVEEAETFTSSAHGDWVIIPEGFFRREIGH